MTTIVDLPFPPSVNRIWRISKNSTRPHLDTRYASWKRVCDNLATANKRAWAPVTGPFEAVVTLDENYRYRATSDADNRLKAVMDWLQRAKLIENDKLAQRTVIQWGHAPEGCRVEISQAGQRKAAA